MNLTEDLQHGVVVLRVAEERITSTNAADLRQALCDTIDQGHRQIVVDLSTTEFLDSIGLAALVTAFKRMGRKGSLALVGVHGAVARLFRLTNMDRVFSIQPTTDIAIAQMRA